MRAKKGLILVAIFVLTFIAINLIMTKTVHAVTQIRSTEIDNIDEEKYPGIKQMIKDLQTSHPNWKFKVLYTGIDWEEVVLNEYTGHGGSPKNLVPAIAACAGEWVCESCTENKYYDNGSWRCASITTIKYMMDARNSINYSDVFQFMELTYQECTAESIKTMVTGTFLDNDSYINAVIEAGKKHNVSPYYIVALAMQEQGKSGSSTISGTYPGYEGYYNIFNINATGNNSSTIIQNALSHAQQNGWTTLELAIDGGVEKISTSYIARGQDTLYLQKFDVDNSDGKLYWHQYQQNILAAQNEGVTIRKTFEEINSIESAYTFVIPVYENMTSEVSKKPFPIRNIDIDSLEKVSVNVNKTINFRATPAGDVIGELTANEILYRLEKGIEKVSGTYWDKVMRLNGTIGYAARETYDYESGYKLYLIPVEEGTTQNPEQNPSEEPETPEEDETLLPETSNEKIKVEAEGMEVTIIPEVTVQEIADLVGKDITAKDKDGNLLGKTSVLGTGSTINDKYTVVMLGDVNGDGKLSPTDYVFIKNHIMQTEELENEIDKKAADINEDQKISPTDYVLIKNYIMN